MDPTLPAIVAASGLSTRMGTSKALLEVQGQTFLARVMSALREGGGGPILVVVRDMGGPEAKEAEAGGGTPIHNPDPSPGPISSLQAGLRALPPETAGTLFCPVDHPLFQAGTVRALIRAFQEQRAPVIAPAFQKRRGHPVVFSREIFRELLEPGLPRGARTVTSRYLDRRVLVEVADPGILADINTPDEFQAHFP